MRNSRSIIGLAAVVLFLTAGPVSGATRGLRLKIDGNTVVEVFDTAVAGELSGFIGETSEAIEVVWLDDAMGEFTPAAPPFSLGTTGPADPGTATLDVTGTWTFTITGVAHGATTVVLSLLENSVPTYTSPDIGIHIEEEAVGVVVLNQGFEVARVVEAQVTGDIRIGAGQSTQDLEVFFLAEDGDFLDLEAEAGFGLRWAVGDTTIASFAAVADFVVAGNGHAIGTTGVQFQIFHIDHVDFTATAIPVVVVSPTDTGGESPAAPLATRLHPASPNPFNPATTLRYDLSRDGLVRIEVIDARGRRLDELANGVQRAGPHTMTWNAPHLAAGTYFVRLVTPDRTATRRVTLLK
jgi:hypothetical protein